MGNIGMPEMIFIMVLALLIFGPKKLPQMGKQLGKALGEFKRASNDLKRSIEDEVEKMTRDEARTEPARPDPLASSPPPATLARGADLGGLGDGAAIVRPDGPGDGASGAAIVRPDGPGDGASGAAAADDPLERERSSPTTPQTSGGGPSAA